MFFTALYFIGCYLLIGFMLLVSLLVIKALGGVWMSRRTKATIWCVTLLLPFIPYVVVGVQTLLFTPMFRPLAMQAVAEDMGDPNFSIPILRVLSITPGHACVYVVESFGPRPFKKSDDSSAAFIFDFYYTRQGWKYNVGDCVWSRMGGNADGNTFPPYLDGG